MKELNILRQIIDTQSCMASYNGLDSTRIQRLCVYEGFAEILKQHPQIMIGYLLHGEKGHHIQSKLFQSFISQLESHLPFSFSKYRQQYYIRSLLDEELNIFDGISVFQQRVNSKGIIKNATVEVYTGGSRNICQRPYFLGKILDVIDLDTHTSLLDRMVSYSFSEITMSKIKPTTSVLVSHLRLTPHYQMGTMALINRIRKEIIAAV